MLPEENVLLRHFPFQISGDEDLKVLNLIRLESK